MKETSFTRLPVLFLECYLLQQRTTNYTQYKPEIFPIWQTCL